jgi:hypothetical protein
MYAMQVKQMLCGLPIGQLSLKVWFTNIFNNNWSLNMEKILKLLCISFFILGLLACSNYVSGENNQNPSGNPENAEDPVEPESQKHKYISIRLGRACETMEEISSYTSSDYTFDDEIEDKNAGIAKGFYYGLQLMSQNCSSYNFELSIEGNLSLNTYISKDWINAPAYGSFYPLYIADDETADSIKITATDIYDETVKGTITLEICEKFNQGNITNNLSFDKKTFLTEKDVLIIRDTISKDKYSDYNLDFSNCRFEFDKIPYCAFCTISPWRLYNWDFIIECDGSADNKLEEDGALINIKSIVLPNNLKEIERFAFAYCYNMKLEELPENLQTIWWDAFLYCKSITVNKIPDSVTRLEKCAFERCDGITAIELPKELKMFDISAFDDCKNISEIEIPATVKTVSSSFGATYFDFNVNAENESFKSVGGILYSKDGKKLYKIPVSKVGYSYSIPTTIIEISRYALSNLEKLNTLNIPSSVLKMEGDAIVNCSNLKTINIDFSEKPDGWDDDWLWYSDGKTINFVRTTNGNSNHSENSNSLNGTYTIKNNTSGQLKFSNGTMEFIYTGITRNTYSYEINGTILSVTWETTQGTFVGQFDIEKTDNGYKFLKKDDIALSWIGTWTHAASTEEIEIYK